MEDKMKRESRQCLEDLFKKSDSLGSGAINSNDMKHIMASIIHNFSWDEELDVVMAEYIKVQRYTTLDTLTRKMEVKYLENAIDFPSALAIAVHFLKKVEKKERDAFAGKGLISFRDLPASEVIRVRKASETKRRLF